MSEEIPPEPWDAFDGYAGCYVCRSCGAAEGYRIHGPGCPEAAKLPVCGDVEPRGLLVGCDCGKCRQAGRPHAFVSAEKEVKRDA